MIVTRRGAIAAIAATAVVRPTFAHAAAPIRLKAAPGEAGLVVPDGPPTKAWLFNDQSPGPVLRFRQGEMLEIDAENGLPEPTTVHWHGLRPPVAMDGAPFISQPPIAPGESFSYRFKLEDAGTFWYHPHVSSSEQVGRGLYGVLIVEEPPEIAARLHADREVVWAIDDWRLDNEAQIAPFGNFHDNAHGGRVGNVLTINGTYLTRETWRAGERIRLRIANTANAQNYRLNFAPLKPWLIALDGHPIAPRVLEGGLSLGAGQRADLIIDVDLEPGQTMRVIDDAYGASNAYEVMTVTASDDSPLRAEPLPAPDALPKNPIALPDLSSPQEHRLIFEGGAMGGMRGAMMGGRMMDMRALVEAGKVWAINGSVPENLYEGEPLFRSELGRTQLVTLENRTRWPHPIHLHGHSFHILEDGKPLEASDVRDTVLLMPQQSAKIAFVADNPGRWMLHCHILEHQASGMMGVVEIG